MIADPASFTLFRFESTAPGRLDIAGAWSGMDRRDVAHPVLVLHEAAGTHRMEPTTGVLGNPRKWSAVFAWDGDPAAIEGAELALCDERVVKLPTADFKQGRHRFERVQLPVADRQAEAVPGGVPPESDVLALHAAMVAAWEDASEAQEEVARLRVEAERARGEARRERARRETESARLHETMAALRRLAEESQRRERDAVSRLDELERRLRAAEADAERVRRQVVSVLRSVRDELRDELDPAGDPERDAARLGPA